MTTRPLRARLKHEPRAARTDRCADRRQRRHRARNRPARARRGGRGRPRRPGSRASQARRAEDVGARSTAAFDATDTAALKRFFDELPDPIDHVLVTGPGPRYGPLLEMDPAEVREVMSDHVVLGLDVARNAVGQDEAGRHAPADGWHGRPADQSRARHRLGGHCRAASIRGLPSRSRLAPVRVNLIAAGFVDTPLSASTPRRGTRSAARGAASKAADRPRRRAGRRRRAGGSHHDQHRADGRDLRHRRRPAVRYVRSHARGCPHPARHRRSGSSPGGPAC